MPSQYLPYWNQHYWSLINSTKGYNELQKDTKGINQVVQDALLGKLINENLTTTDKPARLNIMLKTLDPKRSQTHGFDVTMKATAPLNII